MHSLNINGAKEQQLIPNSIIFYCISYSAIKIISWLYYFKLCQIPIKLYSANMQRPKHETHKKQSIFNPQYTPKIAAKKLTLRKKIIGGQQSAQQGRRPDRNTLERDSEFCAISEQQIRSSAIYRLLEEEIKVLSSHHQIQLKKLRQIKQERLKQQENLQKEQYQTKIQIWQLKNEVLDLKESIKEEKEQTVRLMSELGLQDQHHDQSDLQS